MSEYVLDTHACLFALAAPKKLGRRARRALTQADERGEPVWIPAAAAAEITMLRELGRTELGVPALRQAFEESCWGFLPLDFRQIDEFAALSAIRDPFDRFMVAATRSVGGKLITRDETLRELGLVDVVWS